MKMYYGLLLLACIMPQWSVTFTVSDLHCSWWADYNQFGKSPQVAFQWYKKFLEDQQRPGYMYKGLLHLLQQTNNNNQIILLMPSIEPSFAHDTETQLLFAQALQQAGHQHAADQKFIQLLDKAKDNQQVAFQAAQVFLRRKEPENALQTVKDYLSSVPGNPSNFIFHFLEAQIYLWTNKRQEALRSIEKSLDLQPRFDKGWLMYALLHEQDNKLKKAIQGYTTFLELSDAPSPQIQEHLLRLAFKQKLLEAQEQQLKVDTSCFDQALAFFKKHKYKEALQAIDKCLIQQPKNSAARVLKMPTLNAMHCTDLPIDQLIAKGPFFVDTQALICYKQQNCKEALILFEQSIKQLPYEPLVLKHLAKCYIKCGKKDPTMDTIEQALLQIQDIDKKQSLQTLAKMDTLL